MHKQLSIIVPTYNESGNVKSLYNQIKDALKDINFEVVFVDDNSKDGTKNEILELTGKYSNIRLINRLHKRGLASACIDGFASSSAKYFAVIDADLQHDPKLLKKMYQCLESQDSNIVLASRFLKGSKIEGMSNQREGISKVGNKISSLITGANLTDPLSGYFMVDSKIIEQIIPRLSGKGFKILLDIFSSCKLKGIKLNYLELPTIFRERNAGQSKLDSAVMIEFLVLILDKFFGRLIPVRFILFMLVGGTGVFVHMFVLSFMLKIIHIDFSFSQSIATFVAMCSNFYMNNLITYRDQRIHGIRILYGLISFCAACLFGAIINVIVASYLFEKGVNWFFAGVVGCFVGAVWNYSTTSFLTWRNKN